MLSKVLAFEQDKNAIFLRNQEMHLHYSKLNNIRERKNTFLPNISKCRSIGHSPIQLKDSKTKEQQYLVKRENRLLYNKLRRIDKRQNQMIDDSQIISGYLNIKKHTRERVRELKRKLLQEENSHIINRIKSTKSVINNDKIRQEFDDSRKISTYLRKIHPSSSIGIYLTKNESALIRKYDKNMMSNSMINLNETSINKTNKNSINNGNTNSKDLNKMNTNKNNSQTINSNPIKINKQILAKVRYTGYDDCKKSYTSFKKNPEV